MSNVHALPCVPDTATMHDVIQRIFAHTGGLDGMVEIGFTDARKGLTPPHPLNSGRKFRLADLDEAVEFAATKNADPNCNVYFSAGICHVGAYEYSRAADTNIYHVAACWVDLDAPGSLANAINIAESMALRPNLVTYTGNDPTPRGQMWWVLDEPTADLDLHRRLQIALAAKFNSDPSVINPSRVMRLAGSVAWPIKAERSLEMTGLVDDAATRPAPYAIEEFVTKMERFGGLGAVPAAKVRGPRVASASDNVLDFSGAAPTHDLASLITAAATPGQWHKSALLSVAHLLGRGTREVIQELLTDRLQQPGYSFPDTWAQIGTMVDGGLRRGFLREVVIEAPPAEVTAKTSPFLSINQLADLPPVEWLVEDYLPTIGMSALFAPPGAFKSFLALDIALSVAYGQPWHGFATKQHKVLYIVAEGRGGFYNRIRVWQEHRADGADTDQFALLTAPVNFIDSGCVDRFMDAIDAHLDGVGLIVIDTLARNFGAGDENSTKDMNAYVAGSSLLAERGAQVLHVHHSGKEHSKGLRGSSAFLAALDTSLQLERVEGSDVVTLHVRKQKDGSEAKPMRIFFAIGTGSHVRTGDVIESRVATLADDSVMASASARTGRGAGLSKKQHELLRLVGEGVASLSHLAAQTNADRSNVQKSLQALQKRNLMSQDENSFWHLVVDSSVQPNQEDD